MAKGKLLLIALSENKDEETFEVRWAGTLAGTIVVPKDSDKPIEFKKTVLVKPSQLRLIAGHLYKQFKKEICIHGSRKTIIFGAKDFEKQNQTIKKTADVTWKRYYNMVNKYMGKYREFDNNGKICVEFVLKKMIKLDEALFEISVFLKKYSMIKLSVMQIMPKPITIDNTTSQSEIKSILVHVLTWEQVKKFSDSKTQTTLTTHSGPEETKKEPDDVQKYSIVNRTVKTNIDPRITTHPLTLFCNKNKTIEESKEIAQQKANESFTLVKLLDSNSRFVCNIYPTITAEEYDEKYRNRVKASMYQRVSERQIGD